MQALAGDPSLDPNMVPKADVASDIVVLMEQAARARQQGRIAAAEVYYRMVLERLPPRVLDQVEAKVKESLGRKKVVKPL
jgi:cytochrome c-type biogenesis protein CcmH/NrfG